jgi:hypothetical protein
VPVPGANDSHLLIQRTATSDDGARCSVSVTNDRADPVETAVARLIVYPPPDLRLKWLGAPFTTETVANCGVDSQ